MKRLLGFSLALHAVLAGCAGVLVIDQATVLLGLSTWSLDLGSLSFARIGFVAALVIHLLLMLVEKKLAPKNREKEFHRAASLITHGPYAKRHWGVSIGLGVILPLIMLLLGIPILLIPAGIFALIGLVNEEDLFVKAGQALPIS